MKSIKQISQEKLSAWQNLGFWIGVDENPVSKISSSERSHVIGLMEHSIKNFSEKELEDLWSLAGSNYGIYGNIRDAFQYILNQIKSNSFKMSN